MARSIDDLAKELAELGSRDRAALARTLIDSLDTESHDAAEKAWDLEADRRFAAYRRGEVAAHPADEVFLRVRDALAK